MDIYNKQGSVEIVSVTNIIPKITEKNPAPAWKVQMLETGIFLVTLAFVIFFKGLKRYSSSNLMIARL